MSKRKHENDISIGEDCWVEFGNVAGDWAQASPIDPFLEPIMPLIERLETTCVADCCGIDAFALWPEDIQKAVSNLEEQQLETLTTSLLSLHHAIHELPVDLVVSRRINQSFHKDVFLQVLTHIHQVVENCRAPK